MSTGAGDARRSHRTRGGILAPTIVFLLVVLGAALRIHAAVSDEIFDPVRPEGLLKSDPALLYYVTERVAGARGLFPDDFRADPRIEYPEATDIPATLTVGQELLIGWSHRLLGGDVPLHLWSLWLMAVVASLAVVGVYGLAFELSGSRAWALFGAGLYAVLPANYRTIGFILIREDLSLPLFVMGCWLCARAARTDDRSRFRRLCVATALLGAALATWHATAFVLLLGALAVYLWFLWSDRSPFEARGTWILPAGLAFAGAAVPALRAKAAWCAPSVLLLVALWIVARFGRGRTRRVRLLLAVGSAFVLLGVAGLLGMVSEGGADYAHVLSALRAKLAHGGRFPDDPANLSFDARLLWQGPFEVLTWSRATDGLGAALWFGIIALVTAARGLARRDPRSPAPLLWLGTLLGLAAAWSSVRLIVLPGLFLPVLLAGEGARARAWIESRTEGRGPLELAFGAVLCGGLLAAILGFARWRRDHRVEWYRPEVQVREIAALVDALPAIVPEGEAVAADFMNAPAILAHTGRPILFQPKWESERTRRRLEEFWNTLYDGTPEDLARLLIGRYDCHYVLFDRFTLWILRASPRLAGLGPGAGPRPGSAIEAFLARVDTPADLPGYELVWESPRSIHQSNGTPSRFFQLYRLTR